MRPVRRGDSPREGFFPNYKNAKSDLISRLGNYCSYCERPIATGLAVEHIQPKGLKINGVELYRHLQGAWTNLLLACINCNSTKRDKDVILADILLPDCDNTFIAFNYIADGCIEPSYFAIKQGLEQSAKDTLSLTGLDKKATDIVSQRLNVWAEAEEAKKDIIADLNNDNTKKYTIKLAQAKGFFSIWMKVYYSFF